MHDRQNLDLVGDTIGHDIRQRRQDVLSGVIHTTTPPDVRLVSKKRNAFGDFRCHSGGGDGIAIGDIGENSVELAERGACPHGPHGSAVFREDGVHFRSVGKVPGIRRIKAFLDPPTPFGLPNQRVPVLKRFADDLRPIHTKTPRQFVDSR